MNALIHPADLPAAAPHPASSAEVFAAADGAFQGFVMAHLRGPVLWLQDRQSARQAGRPWLAGALPQAAHTDKIITAQRSRLMIFFISFILSNSFSSR